MISKEDVQVIDDTWKKLDQEKAAWKDVWMQIVSYMGLQYGEWKDAGQPSSAPMIKLTDTTALDSSRILADGVEGYAFSRSMAWFNLAPETRIADSRRQAYADEGQDVDDMAGRLLSKITLVMYQMLAKSNFYDEARAFIRTSADLATGIMIFDWDIDKGRPVFRNLHLKDAWIMEDVHRRVATLFRSVWYTKDEAIDKFGEDKVRDDIRESKDRLKKYRFIELMSPATEWDFDVEGEGDYIAVYLDPEDVTGKTMLEEKLEGTPFACWRWEMQGYGGVWGVGSPGFTSLPAIKYANELQESLINLAELTGKGLWKKTKGLKVNFRAGGVTELDEGQDFALVQAAGDPSWLAEHLSYYRTVIQQNYSTDFFLALTQNIERTKTATEVAALQEEKSALLSSLFARLGEDFLEPMLEWLFVQVLKYAKVPDITEEELATLEDLDIRIDFVSPMFLAQKRNFLLAPTMQYASDLANLAPIFPTILDNFDADAYARLDHKARNADPAVLPDEETIKEVRTARAQAQAQEMQRQQALQDADAMGNLYQKTAKAPEAGSPMAQNGGGQQTAAGGR